jgi:RNA polymerase subunit RPABC4/transcription elongation factor Spt4
MTPPDYKEKARVRMAYPCRSCGKLVPEERVFCVRCRTARRKEKNNGKD